MQTAWRFSGGARCPRRRCLNFRRDRTAALRAAAGPKARERSADREHLSLSGRCGSENHGPLVQAFGAPGESAPYPPSGCSWKGGEHRVEVCSPSSCNSQPKDKL